MLLATGAHTLDAIGSYSVPQFEALVEAELARLARQTSQQMLALAIAVRVGTNADAATFKEFVKSLEQA